MLNHSGRIGRAARVYPDSAQLLHYRVHQRVKSVTTYITAVAERHKPLPWRSAIFFPRCAKPQWWVDAEIREKTKKYCVLQSVCM